MSGERVLNYNGALEYLRKRGAELKMDDLANLTLEALQARVRRKTITPTGWRNKKTPLFRESYLDQWIEGTLPEQQREVAA